jgi:F0F1-type ATP synthase membrane subunit b/b'
MVSEVKPIGGIMRTGQYRNSDKYRRGDKDLWWRLVNGVESDLSNAQNSINEALDKIDALAEDFETYKLLEDEVKKTLENAAARIRTAMKKGTEIRKNQHKKVS